MKLALALAIAQGGQGLLGVVDTLVVGRFNGQLLAGVGIGSLLFMAVTVLSYGFIVGVEPMVTQAIGANEFARAKQLVWQAIWFTPIVCLLIIPVAIGVWFVIGPFFGKEIASPARAFFEWRAAGLLPFLMLLVFRSYLQALGDMQTVLLSIVAVNLTNLLADCVLVYGGAILPEWTGILRDIPSLGAAGAGMASSLAVVVQLGILYRAVSRRAGRLTDVIKPGRAALIHDRRQMIRIGIPVALQNTACLGVMFTLMSWAAALGTTSVAAHQVATSLQSFVSYLTAGLASAGGIAVGWSIGQQNNVVTLKVGSIVMLIGAVTLAVLSVPLFFGARTLAVVLTKRQDLIEVITKLLPVVGMVLFLEGFHIIVAGILHGAADTASTFIKIMMVHYGISLPLAFVLSRVMSLGLTGLWIGYCCGLLVLNITLVRRFFYLTSKPMMPVYSPWPNRNIPIARGEGS